MWRQFFRLLVGWGRDFGHGLRVLGDKDFLAAREPGFEFGKIVTQIADRGGLHIITIL
jgi:hypothetical protein